MIDRTALRAMAAALVVTPLCVWSVLRVRRRRSPARRLLALGAFGFLIVVAAHLCEGFGLLSGMGWGRPHSAGHYLDLTAAALGVILVATGLVMSYWPVCRAN